ncbi:MAG: META domain-containing protein [Acidimicrobiales bacterium]
MGMRKTRLKIARVLARPIALAVALLALCLLAAGCGSDASVDAGSGDTEPDGSAISEFEGEWILIDGEIDGASFAPLDGFPITLNITGDRIGGNASCNGFGGTFAVDGNSLALGDVSITEMACLDNEAMSSEQTFIQAFWRTTGIELTGIEPGETLTLSGDGVNLHYIRETPTADADVIGTVWILDTIIRGDAASSTIQGLDEGNLILDEQGTFTAATGCREIAGTYTLDGGQLELAFDMETYACEEPAGQQDTAVLAVLGKASAVEIDETRLTLLVDDGLNGLSFRVANS